MVSIRRSEIPLAREASVPMRRPWERTGAVDIEALAAWAYGVQMVDRFERIGLHRIEAEAAGFEVTGYSADGVGQLMQIEHLGCRIDPCRVTIRDAVHPAAYALASELASVEGGEMVRAHAQAGTRPVQWVPPSRKARAAVWVREGEEAMVEYQGPGRKGGYCNVILLWDEQREAWGRAQYRRWWQALDDLAWRLQARALGFVLTGPAAPAEPWSVATKSDGARPIALDESVAPPGAPPDGSSQAALEQ